MHKFQQMLESSVTYCSNLEDVRGIQLKTKKHEELSMHLTVPNAKSRDHKSTLLHLLHSFFSVSIASHRIAQRGAKMFR